MDILDQVQGVIEGIEQGKILQTFEQFYDDEVVMTENGQHERVGKSVNRAYERAFVKGVEMHAAKAGVVLVDGNKAAIEWLFDMTPAGGSRLTQRQVALQTWEDGKIVREDFYHG